MGNLIAVIITLFSFSISAANGNYGPAFIFAALMGGMSWVAFGWNINNNNKKKPASDKVLTKVNRGPLFMIGKPGSLFSKKELTPNEFGREITRLGFRMGIDEYGHYLNNPLNTPEDLRLLDIINRNPGFIQLLYANLITGAFLCYAKLLLRVPNDVVSDIKNGILSELQTTMPEMKAEIHLNHTKITEDFAQAIEREVKEIEKNSSIVYFLKGINSFYQPIVFSEDSIFTNMLFSSLDGYGSRVMAFCQNDFVISFKSI